MRTREKPLPDPIDFFYHNNFFKNEEIPKWRLDPPEIILENPVIKWRGETITLPLIMASLYKRLDRSGRVDILDRYYRKVKPANRF